MLHCLQIIYTLQNPLYYITIKLLIKISLTDATIYIYKLQEQCLSNTIIINGIESNDDIMAIIEKAHSSSFAPQS